jgi:hypothetical protein
MSLNKLINYEKFTSTNRIFFKYSLFSFKIFFDLEEIIFLNVNISENNVISVKLAEVLRYHSRKLNLESDTHV